MLSRHEIGKTVREAMPGAEQRGAVPDRLPAEPLPGSPARTSRTRRRPTRNRTADDADGVAIVWARVTSVKSENRTRTVMVRPALPFLRNLAPTRSASRMSTLANVRGSRSSRPNVL